MPRKSVTESVADENAAPGGVAAVDRALSLLAAFRDGDDGLTLAQLSERTRLYKSTVLRLLASLEHGGWVLRMDDGRYAVGPAVARLNTVYARHFSLDSVVMPVLRTLVQARAKVRPTTCARARTGCACTEWIRPIPCVTMRALVICCRWARAQAGVCCQRLTPSCTPHRAAAAAHNWPVCVPMATAPWWETGTARSPGFLPLCSSAMGNWQRR